MVRIPVVGGGDGEGGCGGDNDSNGGDDSHMVVMEIMRVVWW